jgi:hypothetical protein
MRSLCDERGEVRFGLFEEPVEEIDPVRCRLIDEYDRPARPWRRHFGFKQFEFLGGLSEAAVFGCALVNTRYAGTAFVYVYWPETGAMEEWTFRSLFARKLRMDLRPEDGHSVFSARGVELRIGPGEPPGRRHLSAEVKGSLFIDAEWDETDPPTQALRICTRAGAAGWVFARKTAGQRVQGTLRTAMGSVDLDKAGALGHRDWSAGYMRRETFWNWGCLAGRSSDGRVVGLNISCGVNETSFTENCFWLDGTREPVDLVAFEYERTDLMRSWSMRSGSGNCLLRFEPEACHRERLRLGFMGLNFYQLIGRYTGQLVARDGTTVRLERQLGYAEWQYAKW